jgi:RNA polymerase sigma factor (TIGR02999 family)
MRGVRRSPVPTTTDLMNNDVTRILSAIDGGDPSAAAELLPLVYDELRKLAAQRMAAERPGQTLEATALVHDAYLRLVGGDVGGGGGGQHWNGRGHFFAAAAEAMRRILVERARRAGRVRHGAGRKRVTLAGADLEQLGSAVACDADDGAADRLLALDAALTRLAEVDPAAAAVVKLRHFAGLSIADAAAALGVSVRTANRHWAYAKAWLFRQLDDAGTGR